MSDFDKNNLVELKFKGYKKVIMYSDGYENGLCSVISVHNTNLGPALGGTRISSYENAPLTLRVARAVEDVLRLSEGMTYKAAVAGLRLGGGKGVIINKKTKERLERYGEFVNYFDGEFITGEDSGIDENDVNIINSKTKWAVGHVNPSHTTAYGVAEGIKVGVEEMYESDLKSLTVAILGAAGAVGSNLVKILAVTGCKLKVADINEEKLQEIIKAYGAEKFDHHDFAVDCDILSPCLTPGGNFNPETIPLLKCKIIAGATNNQLTERIRDGQALHDKGIFYAPDYVVNMGGLIYVASELPNIDPSFADYDYGEEGARKRTKHYVTSWLRLLYKLSKDSNRPTAKLADELAEEIWKKNNPIEEVLNYKQRQSRCWRNLT